MFVRFVVVAIVASCVVPYVAVAVAAAAVAVVP